MTEIQNYIGGELCPPKKGEYLDNFNPSTGKAYSKVPASTAADVEMAIEAAKNAFPAWSSLSRLDRAGHLRKLAHLIKENKERLIEAESIDQGKPVRLAGHVDIPRAATNLEFFAEKILELNDEVFESPEFGRNEVSYLPLGIVACISPWNLPLYLLTWKIAPALAAGNTVVAKPSEVTPMTAFILSELCIEAGMPPGVLNIIHGTGRDMGDYLTGHQDIKAVSFTGSTATGRAIYQNAAKTFKKVSLEMGGKNPNIIFADCDLDNALTITMRSTFTNQGEVCTCGSRIFIERPIYDEFKKRLIEIAEKIRIGNPQDPKTQHGAMVSKEHFEKVLGYIKLAEEEGGTILCGGEAANVEGEFSGGYFIKPTLIEGLAHTCRTNQEEIFGPVATLTPFDTEEEVLEMANSTEYGLAGTVHTTDIEKGKRIASKVDSGMLWINDWMKRDLNTPFGGMKNSGLGREGGLYGLKFFTQTKNICV
jgi:aminomuconate-semialdehyde/2-hydroxymuconate-6-semialdehyde dehydrogenase